MQTEEQVHMSAVSLSRLEFLFDGIFAIAITILVLELRVPEELTNRRSVVELAHVLGHHASIFGSYLLSFTVLGVLWYRHNHMYQHFRAVTVGMVVLHFVQLATAAFFPFCAALFGRYPFNPLSGLFYVGSIMIYAWASLATWIIARRSGAMRPDVDQDSYARDRRRALRGCVVTTAMFLFYVSRAVA